MRLLARMHKEFNVVISWETLMLNATINKLSKVLMASKKDMFKSIELYEEQEYYPITSIQKNIWFETQQRDKQLTYNISDAFELFQLDLNVFTATLFDILRRHESLRTNFILIRGIPKTESP